MGLTSESAFRQQLLRWGRTNRRSFPWRETSDPFRILVAEVLLQRSRGITVATVYAELFERWPDAASLSRAQVRSIQRVIRPLGLIQRAARLRDLAREIVEVGGVPNDEAALMALPGVGRYAANATLAVAFGMRTPVVDGVTARVYRRYFGLPSDLAPADDRALWDVAAEAMPRRGIREWNWAILDLAAAICLPRVPRCEECPLTERCAWSRARGDRVGGRC